MKGIYQCACSLCGTQKGSNDRNAGWWEMGQRGHHFKTHWFCPECSPGVLVNVDRALDGTGRAPTHRIVSVELLRQLALLLDPNVVEFDEYRLRSIENELRGLIPALGTPPAPLTGDDSTDATPEG